MAARQEARAATKEEVNYRYAPAPEIMSCGRCRFFLRDMGACAQVTGLIRPVDVCDRFSPTPRGTDADLASVPHDDPRRHARPLGMTPAGEADPRWRDDDDDTTNPRRSSMVTREQRAEIGRLLAQLETVIAELKKRYGPPTAVEAFHEAYRGHRPARSSDPVAAFHEVYRRGD
jgi:hypothetical protein